MTDVDYLRFEDRVLLDDGCWEWTGGRTTAGYGECWVDRKVTYAHRAAYELWVGPIPPGASVLHRCDNPGCVRPDHLFVGDHNDNMADMTAKGRHWASQVTHCRKGHPFAGDNLYVDRDGHRYCRACRHSSYLRRRAG